MKTSVTLSIALSFLLSATLGWTAAEAAPEKEKQQPGKLIPLSATFDSSRTLQGHLEVKGNRVALRSRTARRSGNLAAVSPSRRRMSGRATLAARRRALSAITASSAESGFKLAVATSSPRPKLSAAAAPKLAMAVPAQQLQTRVSKSHVQTAAVAQEDADCTCHEARKLVDQKRYSEAAIAYEKYADKLLKTFNKENGDYASALTWQGYSLEMQGRKKEARKILEKAAAVYRTADPEDETLEWIEDRLAEL